MQDMRVLADKLARHPELLGVRGAIQGSNELKTTDEKVAPGGQPRVRAADQPFIAAAIDLDTQRDKGMEVTSKCVRIPRDDSGSITGMKNVPSLVGAV